MARGRAKWKTQGLRSGYELSIKQWLDTLKHRVKYGYEDRKLRYTVPESEHTYTPDFNIYNAAGEVLFSIEAKGAFPPADRKKLLNVRQSNPKLDLRLMFQKDNPIRKGSKTYYSTWAAKNNFLFHVGTEVPREWLIDGLYTTTTEGV